MVGISDEQRQTTRTALIDAFEELMAEVGVGGATVTAIAERAGLARSAFYNYFGDIAELFHAYVAREIAAFAAQRRLELEAIAHPARRLEAFIAGALHGFRHQASPLEAATALGADHETHIEEDLGPLRELIGEILAAGVEADVFGAHASSPVATEIVLHGIGSQRMAIARGLVDPDDVIPVMSRTLLAAVVAGAGGPLRSPE